MKTLFVRWYMYFYVLCLNTHSHINIYTRTYTYMLCINVWRKRRNNESYLIFKIQNPIQMEASKNNHAHQPFCSLAGAYVETKETTHHWFCSYVSIFIFLFVCFFVLFCFFFALPFTQHKSKLWSKGRIVSHFNKLKLMKTQLFQVRSSERSIKFWGK